MNDNEKKLYEEYGRLQNEHKIALGMNSEKDDQGNSKSR